jgi:hypothetical protein
MDDCHLPPPKREQKMGRKKASGRQQHSKATTRKKWWRGKMEKARLSLSFFLPFPNGTHHIHNNSQQPTHSIIPINPNMPLAASSRLGNPLTNKKGGGGAKKGYKA